MDSAGLGRIRERLRGEVPNVPVVSVSLSQVEAMRTPSAADWSRTPARIPRLRVAGAAHLRCHARRLYLETVVDLAQRGAVSRMTYLAQAP